MARFKDLPPINFKSLLNHSEKKVQILKLDRKHVMRVLKKIANLEAASGH